MSLIFTFSADIAIEADNQEEADDRLLEVVNLVQQDLGITLNILDALSIEDAETGEELSNEH